MSVALLAAGLAVVAVIMVLVGVYRLTAGEIDIATRLGHYSGTKGGQLVDRGRSSPLGERMDKAIAGSDFASHLQRELARANLKLTVSEYLAANFMSVLALAALALVISRNPAAALAGAVLGFYLPRFYVRQRQGARLKAFNNQLADVIILCANALRSGYSLMQSLELVSREAPQPAAEEFGRVVKEVNLGLTPEEALANLVRRVESEDLDLMVSAINVQHEVGGNLAHVLDSIANTIRERVRIKGEIKSLTAQQTLSGYVISLLPVAIGFILFLINSKYMMQLFSLETLICFPVIAMPICAGIMLVLGFVIMRRITAIEV